MPVRREDQLAVPGLDLEHALLFVEIGDDADRDALLDVRLFFHRRKLERGEGAGPMRDVRIENAWMFSFEDVRTAAMLTGADTAIQSRNGGFPLQKLRPHERLDPTLRAHRMLPPSRRLDAQVVKTRVLRMMTATWRKRGVSELDQLMRVGAVVFPEYKYRWTELDWNRQPTFWTFIDTYDDRALNADRKWALGQLFRMCVNLPGDTAECGVFNASSSILICEAIARHGYQKTHHLFDSFEGISAPGEKDGEYWAEGNLTCAEEVALKNLEPWKDCVQSWKGWIPDRFDEVADREFCFVHIDVDLFDPTKDSLEFFYPRMVEGGIIVCDDYGFETCPGATEAFDRYLADKPEAMLPLPSGGGFFIKGREVAEPGPTWNWAPKSRPAQHSRLAQGWCAAPSLGPSRLRRAFVQRSPNHPCNNIQSSSARRTGQTDATDTLNPSTKDTRPREGLRPTDGLFPSLMIQSQDRPAVNRCIDRHPFQITSGRTSKRWTSRLSEHRQAAIQFATTFWATVSSP